MYLEKKELNNIVGGASAAIFNAFARIFRTMYDIGYEIGSTIRRLVSKKTCKMLINLISNVIICNENEKGGNEFDKSSCAKREC